MRMSSCDLENGKVYRYISVGGCKTDFDFLVLSGDSGNTKCLILRKGHCDMRIDDVGRYIMLSRKGDSTRERRLLPPEEWDDATCAAVAKYRLCERS